MNKILFLSTNNFIVCQIYDLVIRYNLKTFRNTLFRGKMKFRLFKLITLKLHKDKFEFFFILYIPIYITAIYRQIIKTVTFFNHRSFRARYTNLTNLRITKVPRTSDEER